MGTPKAKPKSVTLIVCLLVVLALIIVLNIYLYSGTPFQRSSSALSSEEICSSTEMESLTPEIYGGFSADEKRKYWNCMTNALNMDIPDVDELVNYDQRAVPPKWLVSVIQTELSRLGYDPGPVDGMGIIRLTYHS